MKFIHRLSLFIIVAVAALPLVIMAQDNRQPVVPTPVELTEDDLPPIPTRLPPTLTDDEAVPPFGITPTFDFHLAQTATLELYEYPDHTLDTCGNDDPDTIFIPVCPPTPTAKPPKTPVPTIKITNGMWVLDPNASGFSSSGSCQLDNGDNGGPDGNGDDLEELPRVPVCMTTDKQWLTVDSGGAYPLSVPNIYSLQGMSRELLYSEGKTSGTVNVTTTRQYQVISPSEIVFSYIRQESGGCTTESTVSYKLIEANDSVCMAVVITPNYTPVPTQMPTAQPGETQQPPITPEPPIQIGEYTIELPPIDATCSADKMPPSNKLNLRYDNNQNMFINFGGGSFTLYWDGGNYYNYSAGNQFDISMVTYSGGASFSWSKEGCFISSPLLGGSLPPTATPAPVEPTSEAVTDAAAIAGSSFSITVDAPAYLCAAENKSMLPDLSGAVLTAQADGSFIFLVGGTDYTLTNENGIHGFMKANDDGSLLSITMNGFYEGSGMGSFVVVSADGKSCIAQLTFKPKG